MDSVVFVSEKLNSLEGSAVELGLPDLVPQRISRLARAQPGKAVPPANTTQTHY